MKGITPRKQKCTQENFISFPRLWKVSFSFWQLRCKGLWTGFESYQITRIWFGSEWLYLLDRDTAGGFLALLQLEYSKWLPEASWTPCWCWRAARQFGKDQIEVGPFHTVKDGDKKCYWCSRSALPYVIPAFKK